MHCNLPNKDSLNNTRSFLEEIGVIDSDSQILNKQDFLEAAQQLSNDAIKAYGVTTPLWQIDPSNNRLAIPNLGTLREIDQVKEQLNLGKSAKIKPNEVNIQVKEDQDLRESIVAFTKKINPDFKIEVLDDLLETKGVSGIANIKEFKIQLQSGLETNLSEEAAHFLIELLPNDHSLKERMLDEAPRTRLYKSVFNEYKEVYGNDIDRIKRETAAKLVSLYLTDKELFKYWSGSDSLVENLIRWIKDFFKWLKGNKQLNSFIEGASKITNLDITGIRLENAALADDMFSLADFMNKTQVLESVGDMYIKNYDQIYINLNDTILDYQNYPGTPDDKRKMLFDTRFTKERDNYYLTSKLTTLGRELSDKIKFISPEKITFFTQMIVSDALRSRLIQEFGNVNIERINVQSLVINEETGEVIREEEINSLKDVIERNQSTKPLVIDNSARPLDVPHEFRRFNTRKSEYTSLEVRRRREELKNQRELFERDFKGELELVEKSEVIQKVKSAFDIIRRELRDAKKTEFILEQMGEDEVSKLFRDEYGNLTLPLSLSQSAARLVEEAETYEKGLTQFLLTLEATTKFFKDRNMTKFKSTKELIESGSEEDLEKAIQELYTISRMGTDWQNYIREFRKIIKDVPETSTVDKLLGDLDTQISRTKALALELSNDVIGKRLSSEFEVYNLNIQSQIDEFKKQEQTDRIKERIAELESQLKSPEDIFKVLAGETEDISNLTVWIKTLHNSGDPLIGSIGKLMQKAFAEVELSVLQRSQDFGARVAELQQQYGIDDKTIQDELITTEKTRVFDSEADEYVSKDRLAILNPFQNIHEYEERRLKVDTALTKLKEAKSKGEDISELEKEYFKEKEEFDNWENTNWYKPYVEVYYERYNELQKTDEDKKLFNEVREEQIEIYEKIKEVSAELQSETTREGKKEKLRLIQDLRRELKNMKRDVYFDGSPKVGKDLQKAKMLQRKSEIDRDFNEYVPNLNKFKTEFSILLNTLELENDVRKNLEILANKGDNFSELYEYAKQNAPFEVVEWLDDNTIIRYSDEWYQNRNKLAEGISKLVNEINEALGITQNLDLKKSWEELITLTSPLRDEDNILDGTATTPEIQKKVLSYEKLIEKAKKLAREEKSEKDTSIVKDKKNELKQLILALHELQNKVVTEAYNEYFVTLATNTGFLQRFNSKYPQLQFSENSNLLPLIDTEEFLSFLDSENNEFTEWFRNNHYKKTIFEAGEEREIISPTYIWFKIEPKNSSDILTVPNFQYSVRKIKDEFKTEKTDWITWNPITKRYLPKGRDYFNPAYLKLMQDSSNRGQGLKAILKEITNFHLETQANPMTPSEAKLVFGLPYIAKRSLETTEYFKNIYRNFIQKDNRFEKGEANYDESQEAGSFKNRVISWFNGLVGKTTAKETHEYTRIAVPYTHYMSPEETSKDVLLTSIMFAGSTSKAQRMLKESKLFNLIEESLQSSNVQKDAKGRLVSNNKNRYAAFRFYLDHHVYGMNKQYELGKPLDRALTLIRQGNTFGTLGLPIGFANTLKNNLQGRLQNLIGNKFGDWSDNRSMTKASANLNINFFKFLSEIERKPDQRSLDYHILTFFNPNHLKQGELVLKGGSKRVLQDKTAYMFNEGMEFAISSNLLYGHLYHQKVKGEDGDIKTLYEILEVKNGKLSIKPGYKNYRTGRAIDENYLLDTKLAYRTVTEYVQGKVDGKTLLSTYTIGQTLLYFKNWMVPMIRRRFDKSRPNYIIGENLEGYWRTFGRLSYRIFKDFLKEGKMYWNTYTEEEKRNYMTTLKEIAFVVVSSLLISLIFGFDANDPDKYKKLKQNSYAENLSLLIALQAKSETETLTMMPFFNVESQVVPPFFTETIRLVKNPTTGFAMIENTSKTFDALYNLALNKPNAYYDKNIPAFNIEKGDSKAGHYLLKVAQIDKFLYATENPEGKIQGFITNIKR